MSLSEKIADIGMDLTFYPLNLAYKAPRELVRFLCFPLAIPFCFVTLLLSLPFMLAMVIAEMWEEAHKEN